MKIAYNSTYVQTETFNFTFAQKAIMCMSIFVRTSKKSLCQTSNINVQADYIGLYINSQQTINRLQPFTDLLLLVILVQTCCIEHAKEAHSHSWHHAIVSPSEKSPSVKTVTPDCMCSVLLYSQTCPPRRLCYAVAKGYLLLSNIVRQ